MKDLIDTTEMYLKTIYELMEDGVPTLRARIVDRLGHSGPTVSQTVSRMERDGLLTLQDDRQIQLTERGLQTAVEVMRKHRVAERLLLDVLGLGWVDAHGEACRWEHVISERVEYLMERMIASTTVDPYGNPIPPAREARKGQWHVLGSGEPLSEVLEEIGDQTVRIVRIGEPIQAQFDILSELFDAKLLPGKTMRALAVQDGAVIRSANEDADQGGVMGRGVTIPREFLAHFFVKF